MIRNILIVDRDKDFLLFLKNGLSKPGSMHTILTAANGAAATEMLKNNHVSLVVADFGTCGMKEFTLLAHTSELYPDIPVVVMTTGNDPETERLAREGGAAGYITKDTSPDKICGLIETIFQRESDCGLLHGVSSGMFLQLMEMEQKTCTIRVCEKSSGKQGVLFFRDGELLDARCLGLRAEAAAHRIFSWEEVSISIQGICPLFDKKMQGDLQAILLEAMRLKDEAGAGATSAESNAEGEEETVISVLPEEEEEKPADSFQRLEQLLAREGGARGKLLDINSDGSWDALASAIAGAGDFFAFGTLKGGYIDRGEQTCCVLLPGEKTQVAAVNAQCSRDRIIQLLDDQQ